METNLSKN